MLCPPGCLPTLLLPVQRREQRLRVSHANAVPERQQKGDRLLDVLPRFVAILALDKELREIELDQEPEPFLIWRQVRAKVSEGVPGDLRSLSRSAEHKARIAEHHPKRALCFSGRHSGIYYGLIDCNEELSRKSELDGP